MSFTFYLSFQRDNHDDEDDDDDNEPGSKRPRQEGNLASINQPEIQAWSGKKILDTGAKPRMWHKLSLDQGVGNAVKGLQVCIYKSENAGLFLNHL